MGRNAREGIAVDLEVADWQVVEIPLDESGITEPIESVAFAGNLEGTFYIDDLRLVAAEPPPPRTAVVEDRDATVPKAFALSQNYPNPFNPETTIRFDLPQSQQIELAIYNLAAQRVATLVQGYRAAGSYSVR